MIKPESINCRLANWSMLLSLYDMWFIPQKAIKGHEITNFHAKHPISKSSKLYKDILYERAEMNITS